MALTMLSKLMIFLLLGVSFLCKRDHFGVEGARKIIISKEDDLELESQLKILNKSPIKSIQTEKGDTFDCVDIHKQPALDHPLLKDHKIKMRPTSQPKVWKPSESQRSTSVFKRLDCPDGTVPIRRTRKEDLIRAKSFFESHSTSSINEVTKVVPGQHVAIRRSKYTNDTRAFRGVHGYINVANPIVGNEQFSSAQVWVEGAPPYQLNTLQAGWAVAPQLFGDNVTRLFVYSSTDPIEKQGCYNLLCQGFVQVDKGVAVGSELSHVSVYKGDQYIIHLTLFQDAKGDGDWWLRGPDDVTLVGYWPRNLFKALNDGAQSVAWGGLARGTPEGPSPQMGNGHFPDHGHYDEASSVVHLQVVDSDGLLVDQPEPQFENFVDNSDCYNLEYNGFVNEDQRFSFLFGGPGGNNCGR